MASSITMIRVKVRADASKEILIRKSDTLFEVSVKEPPHGNRANARVRTLLAQHLCIPLARVRLLSGHHSPSKKFEIRGSAA
ncbi:MAG: DUF167 domain-containing protein [Minisyncoccia bacterium]